MIRMFSKDGRLGDRAWDHDRHLPHPDAVSRDQVICSHAGRATDHHLHWDLYDTRHVVFRPARLTPQALKDGYDWAYREFYRWPSIMRGSLSHGTLKHQAKHFFYAAGWKKFERLWDCVIRARQLAAMTPVLEAVLSRVTRSYGESRADDPPVCQSEHVTSLAPGDSAPDPSVAPLLGRLARSSNRLNHDQPPVGCRIKETGGTTD